MFENLNRSVLEELLHIGFHGDLMLENSVAAYVKTCRQ